MKNLQLLVIVYTPTWQRMMFWEQTTSRLHSNFLLILSLTL